MGRPKVVEFTGLEDQESLDSRPAKKKSKKAEEAEVKTAAETAEPSSEAESNNDEANLENIESQENETLATESNDDEAKEVEEAPKKDRPKVGTAKIRSKRYQSLTSLIEKGKAYPVDEALETLKKTVTVKFDPTLEVHINLGVDVTKTDQQIRTTTMLPHSTGKKINLLVFGNVKEEDGVKVGDEKTIETIEKTGKVEADKIIATAEWMPKLTKVAKILGPKGLMPNPKTGTVTSDVAKTVNDFKGGLLEIRTEASAPLVHTRVGKLSQEPQTLKENLKALIDTIHRVKPTNVKRNYLKSVYLHTTMGPSVKLDLSSLNESN